MFWKLRLHLAALFVIVTSQNKVGLLNGAVDGGSNLVGGIFNFFGNIPKILQPPSNANDREEENFEVTDDISINERIIADNTKEISNIDNGDNELFDVMNNTNNKESEDEASPNIIQFGKVVVDGAVGEGSKLVGGVFNFFGNIPKIFPRPTVSFERVENKDDIEVRNGSVEEGDDVAMLENSEIDLVLESSYCGVKVPASSLVEVIRNISHFSIFLDLVEFSDVESELSRDGGVTVLAPDNHAFAKLDMSRVDMLFSDQDLAKQVSNEKNPFEC